MQVEAAYVNHSHGGDIFVAKTEEELYVKLADFVKEWWDELHVDESFEDFDSNKEAVEFYFESHGAEWVDLSTVTI